MIVPGGRGSGRIAGAEVKLQYGHYADQWRDRWQATSWRGRLGYRFKPPDWEPAARKRTVPSAA